LEGIEFLNCIKVIFISHNSKDKEVIEPIAKGLAKIFGEENIFYDSWSIKPGDSLVSKMDEGLAKCKFFLLFASRNSLNSEMVKLEWKNALVKSTKGNLRLIPIRLENVEMPSILTDTLFIDATKYGQEDVIRQIKDVIEGNNNYKDDKTETGFHNLVAYLKKIEDGVEIEFKAQQFMEPISRYLILLKNEEQEIKCSCPGESMFTQGFNQKLKLNNGTEVNAISIGVNRPTAKGFPLTVILKKGKDKDIEIVGVMKADTQTSWSGIPLMYI